MVKITRNNTKTKQPRQRELNKTQDNQFGALKPEVVVDPHPVAFDKSKVSNS